MSFVSRNLIHEVVIRTPTTARDSNGDFVASGVKTRIAARVEARTEKIRGPDNNEITTTHRFYCETEVPPTSQVWVPFLGDDDTDENDARRPLSVRRTDSLRGGATLFTVYL